MKTKNQVKVDLCKSYNKAKMKVQNEENEFATSQSIFCSLKGICTLEENLYRS